MTEKADRQETNPLLYDSDVVATENAADKGSAQNLPHVGGRQREGWVWDKE